MGAGHPSLFVLLYCVSVTHLCEQWGPKDNFFASRLGTCSWSEVCQETSPTDYSSLGKGQYTTVGAYDDRRTPGELEKTVSWDQLGNVQFLREKYKVGESETCVMHNCNLTSSSSGLEPRRTRPGRAHTLCPSLSQLRGRCPVDMGFGLAGHDYRGRSAHSRWCIRSRRLTGPRRCPCSLAGIPGRLWVRILRASCAVFASQYPTGIHSLRPDAPSTHDSPVEHRA